MSPVLQKACFVPGSNIALAICIQGSFCREKNHQNFNYFHPSFGDFTQILVIFTKSWVILNPIPLEFHQFLGDLGLFFLGRLGCFWDAKKGVPKCFSTSNSVSFFTFQHLGLPKAPQNHQNYQILVIFTQFFVIFTQLLVI